MSSKVDIGLIYQYDLEGFEVWFSIGMKKFPLTTSE